jgi:glycerol-3-phosphate dehydrogenase
MKSKCAIWLKKWAQQPEDVLWRRTKHRLHLSDAQQQAFSDWFTDTFTVQPCAQAS